MATNGIDLLCKFLLIMLVSVPRKLDCNLNIIIIAIIESKLTVEVKKISGREIKTLVEQGRLLDELLKFYKEDVIFIFLPELILCHCSVVMQYSGITKQCICTHSF